MKEIEPTSPQDNKVITAEQRQVKAETYLESMTRYAGHTIFEFDMTTGEINPAKIDRVDAEINPNQRRMQTKTTIVVKVTQRPHCLYTSALNKKNAVKKLIPLYAKLKQAGRIGEIKQR